MRERTLKVDRTKLLALSELHKSTSIADRLEISKQRWHHYKTKHDMPESVVDRLCEEYKLDKGELVLAG